MTIAILTSTAALDGAAYLTHRGIVDPNSDKIKSLFNGNPQKLCSFCDQQECECQTITKTKIDVSVIARSSKFKKRLRALERLRKIFREDQPICRFD